MGIAKEIKARTVVMQHDMGATIAELAKMHGLSKATIRNYIREDKERKADKVAAERKEAEKKKNKELRDKERRASMEERIALADERKKRVKADIEAGMSYQEAADKEGISSSRVADFVRGDRIPDALLTYKDTLCIAVQKRELTEWAKKQLMSSIKTPEGKMIVTGVYPHILECAKRRKDNYIITTFTLGEVYYLNQGGQV